MDYVQRESLRELLSEVFEEAADPVETLNEVREVVAAFSPFHAEPVDLVRWVLMDRVQGNDYNPNSVAPPEMGAGLFRGANRTERTRQSVAT